MNGAAGPPTRNVDYMAIEMVAVHAPDIHHAAEKIEISDVLGLALTAVSLSAWYVRLSQA